MTEWPRKAVINECVSDFGRHLGKEGNCRPEMRLMEKQQKLWKSADIEVKDTKQTVGRVAPSRGAL